MTKNMKIRYAIYAVIIVVLLVIPFVETSYDLDMKALRGSLKTQVNKEYVVSGDKSDLRKFYHLSFDDIDDFILYVPATTMRVNEVAIFKVKEGKEEKMMQVVNDRRDFQKNVFEGYGAKQCKQLDNAVLEQHGQYIVYIVGEDAKNLFDVVEKEVE